MVICTLEIQEANLSPLRAGDSNPPKRVCQIGRAKRRGMAVQPGQADSGGVPTELPTGGLLPGDLSPSPVTSGLRGGISRPAKDPSSASVFRKMKLR